MERTNFHWCKLSFRCHTVWLIPQWLSRPKRVWIHGKDTSCDVKWMYWGSRKAFYSIKFYFELSFDLVLHVLRCCSRSTMDSRIQESMFWVKAIRKVWNDQKSKSISNPAFWESEIDIQNLCRGPCKSTSWCKNSSTHILDIYQYEWFSLEYQKINDFISNSWWAFLHGVFAFNKCLIFNF